MDYLMITIFVLLGFSVSMFLVSIYLNIKLEVGTRKKRHELTNELNEAMEQRKNNK